MMEFRLPWALRPLGAVLVAVALWSVAEAAQVPPARGASAVAEAGGRGVEVAAAAREGRDADAGELTGRGADATATVAVGAESAEPRAGARSLVDDRGRSVMLPAQVRRLVSLSPALTESVCVLGACERLVGVDRFSNWPDSVARLPRLGGLGSFNVEAVAALRPDAVLMADDGPLVQQLERLGVAVLVLSPKRHADVAGVLQRLGQVLGVPQQRAQALWNDIRHELRDLAESLPARDRGLHAWVEVDPAPWLAGPDSFLGETLALLGLANVVPAGSAAFVPMSREWALQVNPQLLVISDPQRQGLAALRARPGWSRLAALREGRVCLFDGAELDVLVRPGPRLAEGARLLRDCVRRVRGQPASGQAGPSGPSGQAGRASGQTGSTAP